MKINLFTKTGTKSEKSIELAKDVFGVEINADLLNKVIKVYLANQRQANAKAKTRGEVRGGGKKPWRQKGTGRARTGSLRSPIFKGGGVTFGPTSKDNHKLKINKKEKQNAIRSALSAHAQEKSIIVFEDFAFGKEKYTATLAKTLSKAKIDGKALIVQPKADSDLTKAAGNLPRIKVEVVNSINAYQILNAGTLILNTESLDMINKLWGSSKKKVEKKKEVKEEVKKETKKTATKKIATKKTEKTTKK